ncbi:L-asparaginase [Nocardioides ginsengisegetis]|uniref:L-asparaginase n=1 Tax=Nocardioides ginsengisegetis TaxID=661491 RepID=A0A7W3IZ32_9ACTN|nr:asparaginase [Nocardioides ginsengisegetis]MBA8803267.1 L-asparaginase [Nocardioides ginsengisegetis]
MSRARIAILSTGGTITSTRDAGGAAAPRLSASQLVETIPGLQSIAEFDCTTVRTVASKEMTLDDAVLLARAIDERAGSGFDGVVVLQGTDTLEEMAFAVDLLITADIPVAFTAAMRHPDMPSADGAANLSAAVLVAASSGAVGMGVTVVLDDTIQAARYVRKAHTSSLSAFQSPSLGVLGWILEGEVHIKLRPTSRPVPFPVTSTATFPPVAVVSASLDDDLGYVDHLEALGYQGLVVQGLGGGHLPAAVADRICALAQHVPVVISSRTGAGQVLRKTYGTVGGDIDLAARGLISAGHLDGPKARILLRMLLAYDGNAHRFNEVLAGL